MEDIDTLVGEARSTAGLMAAIAAGGSVKTATDEQRIVIEAGLEPTLVVAGAGSGKTETLSLRILYLLDHARELFGTDISPDEILCLTFTRKAAAEIADRSQRYIVRAFGGAEADVAAPVVATYNGYASALAMEHGLRVGVDPDSTVLTPAALWQLASQTLEEWTLALETTSAASTITSAIPSLAGQLRDHGVTPAELIAEMDAMISHFESLPKKVGDSSPGAMTKTLRDSIDVLWRLRDFAQLVVDFDERKRQGAFIDYADQVAIACELAMLPAVQSAERGRFRAVLLDEFQDTSPAQLELFSRLFEGVPVMAVGDPNQAIYGFRGASAAALEAFVGAFGGPGVVKQASLSTSWRNDQQILAAANESAAPLRESTTVEVAPLRVRPGAEGAGPVAAVSSHVAATADDEAMFIADYLAAQREQTASVRGGEDITMAVLCRRRSQIAPIADALRIRGLPFEVMGLGGLMDTPEVADLLALLEVAHDPSRGDSLMRLLTSARVNLGPRDLVALNDWARHLAGPRDLREGTESIVDALADPPPATWVSSEGRSLSQPARERLDALSNAVAQIRRHTYLPLTELVTFTERVWGLDVEAAVSDPTGRTRRNVDAFVNAVRSFTAGAEHATLGALIEWLGAVRREEAGLELPAKDPEPGAVQLLTVHGAKGLEWDVVAVPGLCDTKFPGVRRSQGEYSDAAWLTGTNLPWHLRMDAARLPRWAWRDVVDHADLAASMTEFRAAAGEFAVDEERRLFYVALTRARSRLLLSASWFSTGVTIQKVSPFLEELVSKGLADAGHWAAEPAADERPPEEVFPPMPWPRPVTANQKVRRLLADAVANATAKEQASGASGWNEELPWGREVAAILVERAERNSHTRIVAVPTHVSTSGMVALRRDREAFLSQVRRPMPQEPTVAAHRGTTLHTWIESHYGKVPLITADDLGPDEEGDADLEQLKVIWDASEWAVRTPSDVEVDVELPLAGRVIRSRIDAVFPVGRGLDKVTVVDWKSGRPPRDAAEKAAREVQLAVYRLAWAEWKGLEIDDVDAAFYYVATDETVRPQRLLSREELEELIGD